MIFIPIDNILYRLKQICIYRILFSAISRLKSASLPLLPFPDFY